MNEQDISKQRAWAITSMVLLIMDVIGILVLTVLTMTTKAHFEKAFKDLGVQLPIITGILLSIPSVIYLGFFGGLIVMLVLKEKFIQRAPLRFTVNLFAAVVGLAYLALYMIAMFLPLIQTIDTLNKGK